MFLMSIMVDRTNADFYLAFENKYRGTREQIKSRLRVYLPFVVPFLDSAALPKPSI